MLRRLITLSALLVLIAGCATRNGSDFTSLSQSIGPPKAGQARVVILREKAFAGLIDQGWEGKVDGEQMRDLKTGTYVYADRPAGRHRLSSTVWGWPGETQYDVTLAAGRTNFFVSKLSERAKAVSAATTVGGLARFAVAAAATSGASNLGPVEFVPLDEAAGREAVAELRLAE
jgi:hypothetical protein